MKYWLMKSEARMYPIDKLKRDGFCSWDGVRNFQARNFMRDEMRVGDLVLFYHSSVTPAGVAGICRVSREAYPDHTAWDPKSPYYDPKATPENKRWMMVEVEFIEEFPHLVTLEEIRAFPELKGMRVLQKGSRLSIMPVERAHFEFLLQLGKKSS